MDFKIKKVNRLAISVASFAAMSAINYTIIHNPIVLLGSIVLLVHEFGHYIMAKHYGADAQFPIFIPLIFASIGITQVFNLDDMYKSSVALAGPLLASCFIICLMLFNFIYKFFSAKILLLLLAGEIILNYIGLDGKKYRKFKQNNLSISFS
ncbi:MAG: hypothetical protein O3A39_04760 [Proteobacteria bacterium]|nr:hypothetical protein [Pseudomonadota bacterium]